ncbi:serine hydrolase [Lentzea sp. HUAS TT2]|uniref:serine hydrolase n=1 Tax=Lentzea sp. HUAS TT2 TaxID=3447454 RepID=UPI003F72FB6B
MIAVLAAVVVVLRTGSDEWRSRCTEFTPVAGEVPAVQKARQALVSAGHDPVLSMEIVDLDTCATVLSWKGDLVQPTASVVKLLIALDLLQRTSTNSDDVENDITAMLTRSDDGVASRLWQHGGGSEIVTRQVKALGLRHTRPPAVAGQWGSTVTSASDVSRVYRHIAGALEAEDRELLTTAMAAAPRAAADGVDQYFGIPSGLPGATWAVKQGWGSSGDRRVLNSTGFVKLGRTYAVTLLSSWRKDVDLATMSAALTKAVEALRGSLA